MKKKVDLNKLMDEVVYISNQINGLEMLLEQKKAIVKKYFDKTGERNLSNEECTLYVQERTNIKYDMKALEEVLEKEVLNKFVERTINIVDKKGFGKLCKKYKIPKSELKEIVEIKKEVNQSKLSDLYEKGVVELEDLEGCYTATVKKSVALRMKNIEREIKLQ